VIVPTLAGVTAKTLTTGRLTTRVLFAGDSGGAPVLFLHGNLSSATWWEETMLALPPGFWGIAPDQRGFGEADPSSKIDATRGMGDLADDALALLDHLGIGAAHVVGNSLGGCVVWRLLMDHADRLLSVTLPGPGSPYGFGGTKDADGTPCYDDYAGSGGGMFNRSFVQLIRDGDTGTDHRFSPRNALRDLVYRRPFIPAREDDLVAALLMGATNALSPKYAGDVTRLYAARPKPAVLWVRGADDVAISDRAVSDTGTLGMMGLIKNHPGADVFPPQPMLRQTRAVLERYAATGGSYREVVLDDCGHLPFTEKPDEFNAVFHQHLQE
jgi:pimeloyl-ACP methyl ester carboxylesterase